jgi:hypothetical protein
MELWDTTYYCSLSFVIVHYLFHRMHLRAIRSNTNFGLRFESLEALGSTTLYKFQFLMFEEIMTTLEPSVREIQLEAHHRFTMTAPKILPNLSSRCFTLDTAILFGRHRVELRTKYLKCDG